MSPTEPHIGMLKDPGHFLSLGFGSGLAPKAPGTFGTLAALVIYLPMAQLDLVPYIVITIGLFLLGIWLCGRTASSLGTHDHGAIVWDEIVGFLITMALVECSLKSVILGFLLFRLFDILKPWPISWLDKKVHGGLGIMLDDVIAGIFALAILEYIEYLSYI